MLVTSERNLFLRIAKEYCVVVINRSVLLVRVFWSFVIIEVHNPNFHPNLSYLEKIGLLKNEGSWIPLFPYLLHLNQAKERHPSFCLPFLSLQITLSKQVLSFSDLVRQRVTSDSFSLNISLIFHFPNFIFFFALYSLLLLFFLLIWK